MDDALIPIVAVLAIFVGMPWIILHYITKWKQQAGNITREDESLLEELYDTARRLDDRINSIERIVAAETPELEMRRPAPELPRAEIRQIREK